MTPPEILTPEQAGAILQVPAKTVVQLCREGRLDARKVGRRWRIHVAAIARFFEAPARVEPPAHAPAQAPGGGSVGRARGVGVPDYTDRAVVRQLLR